MRQERTLGDSGVIALVGAAAVCCGLPVLLSLGVGTAVAGLGRDWWALVLLGLTVAALGVVGLYRRNCRINHHREGPSMIHLDEGDRAT
jgi:hypothetical protein